MAGAAVFAADYREHINIAATRLEGKADIAVTGLAGVTYTMKPVRKNHRPNAILVRGIIEDHIAVFGAGL